MTNKKNILVIDDEKTIRTLLKINLERAGYNVLTSSNGLDALSLLEDPPNLIIIDWMLPLLNGIDFTKKIKNDLSTKDIPIIMLTAKSLDNDVLKAWENGIDCYISKPFNPMELLYFVKKLLET